MERLEKGTLDSCLVVMGACDCGAGSVWAWCPNFALSKVVALEKVRRNPGLGMSVVRKILELPKLAPASEILRN